MRPSLRGKRLLLRVAEPLLRVLYLLYRLVSLELFRSQRLPEGEALKILVVRLDTIGDILLSEPALATLRQRFPRARIDMVLSPAGKELLSGNPNLDSLIPYEAPWHAAWRGRRVDWGRELGVLWRTLHYLRREAYDLAFELRGDPRDILFTVATGTRVKVGNGWRGCGFLLDQDVPVPLEAHRVDFAMGIVGAFGASEVVLKPRIYLGPRERSHAQQLLGAVGSGPRVALHLGAGFPSKCLPLDKFAWVASSLHQRQGCQFLVLGGPEERGLAEEFQQKVSFPTHLLTGGLSLKETAAVLERCHLFLGNDSAPMHIAAALGVPVVTFFGPSEPVKYHPYGVPYRLLEVDLPCRPCDHVHCQHGEYLCMTLIPEEEILSAAEELLAQSKRPLPAAI